MMGDPAGQFIRQIRGASVGFSKIVGQPTGGIGKTHINRIENGSVARVSLTKLRALAHGLGVLEDDLIAVAQGKLPVADVTTNEEKLLNCFRQLSADRRKDILVMVQALARTSDPEYKAGELPA